jgi:hypothetical protein
MAMGLATKMAVNVMIDKKLDRIREQLQEEIEKLREQGEVPEILDLIRQIERANERLQKTADEELDSVTTD